MSKYLLEVGTENLPVEFQSSAAIQLVDALSQKLREERLDFGEIKTYYTPRRLAVVVSDLSEKQTDEVKEVKGPPASVAFKDGHPTPAAEGFARKVNVPVEKLAVKKFDDIEYTVAVVEDKGKDCGTILQQVLPDLVLNLKGSHFMRWENLDVRFSRPIRWLTSVLNDQELPVTIAEITATANSYGHRFLSPEAVKVSSPDDYKNIMKDSFVMVDPAERKETIIRQLEKIASDQNGIIQPNEKLLNIVNNLVEWPIASMGSFDEKYLHIPDDVITTVMAVHQKYFPIYDLERRVLLNYFICVNDRNGSHKENIIKGNQRVLKARLEDAEFYYREDRKMPLGERIESLKGITFQKGLGTMYDKMLRIKCLSAEISDQLELDENMKNLIIRTAELCKADLITSMVREFTELEGIIGSIYSMQDNEKQEVSWGIGEHYLPRSSDDIIPRSMTGTTVSIADKLDTIVSVFSIGKSPTGSADPLGLRRAALGVIMIVLKDQLDVNISLLIEKAYGMLGDIKKEPEEKVIPQVRDFIIQRLRIYLNEQNYRYDSIEAVLNSRDPLVSLNDTVVRTILINKLVNESDYTPFHESSNRLIRILKGAEGPFEVRTELLSHDSEKQLNEALDRINPDELSYEDLINKLKGLTPVIEKFFDDVLVMDKDDQVRKNRLSLVNKAAQKYQMLADFSKVVN